MATLPDIDNFGTQRPSLRVPKQIVQDRSGEIIGDAVARLGETITQSANQAYDVRQREIAKQKDDTNRLEASTARSSFLIGSTRLADAAKADTDWKNLPQKFDEGLLKLRMDSIAGVSDPKQRALLDQQLMVDASELQSRINAHANELRISDENATTDNLVDGHRVAAITAGDDAQMAAHLGAAGDLIRASAQKGNFGPNGARIAEDKIAKLGDDFAVGRLETQPLAHQIEVLKNPEKSYAAFLSPDKRAILLARALKEKEALDRESLVEARQIMSDRYRDIQAAALSGVAVTKDQIPSLEESKRLFGNHEGAMKHDLATKQIALGGDIAGLQNLTNEQIVAKVDTYRPTQVSGAAEQSPMHSIMQQAASHILTDRTKDPVGYLVSTAPATQAAWRTFQSAQGDAVGPARDAYFSALKADSQRLGLDPNTALPDDYAKATAEQIRSSPDANGLAAAMQAEAAKWGDHWNAVLPQLAKSLPDFAVMAGSGLPQSSVQQLAKMAAIKKDDLKSYVPAGRKLTDIEGMVADQFGDFLRSFPVGPQAQRTSDAVRESALRLSLGYMHDLGESPSNAIKRAYADLVQTQNQVAEMRGHMVRFPAGADAGAIRDGAEAVLQKFSVQDTDLERPANANFPMETYKNRANHDIQTRGYFVTAPDGKGLQLYLDGQPFGKRGYTYTWDELRATSAATSEQRAREAPVIRNYR